VLLKSIAAAVVASTLFWISDSVAKTDLDASQNVPVPAHLRCETTIGTFFGSFTVPLGYLALRPFKCDVRSPTDIRTPETHRKPPDLLLTLMFWMPNGEAEPSRPGYVLRERTRNSHTGEKIGTPFRPPIRNIRRSLDNYVVVVGAFCPLTFKDRALSDGEFLKNQLATGGYGAGALSMFYCAANAPGKDWQIASHKEGIPPMYCNPEVAQCFGWIRLEAYAARALVFIPNDAVHQTQKIKVRLDGLLKRFETR
jgi:hypothetical protein